MASSNPSKRPRLSESDSHLEEHNQHLQQLHSQQFQPNNLQNK
ncbi:4156_t:CDS:1, partial [Dentiscutata erythropus]